MGKSHRPINMSSPAIIKGQTIYIGSLDSGIYTLNEMTGDVMAYFDMGAN